MKRQAELTFTIKDGEITFDVENGDGKNCEVLASIFLDEGDVSDYGHKTEYDAGVTVSGNRTRA